MSREITYAVLIRTTVKNTLLRGYGMERDSMKILLCGRVKNSGNKTLRDNFRIQPGYDMITEIKTLQPWPTSKPGNKWMQCKNGHI
jgi:hypothetical protein